MAKVTFFQTYNYEKNFFETQGLNHGLEFTFLEAKLNAQTAQLAAGHEVVCSFVNDSVDRQTIQILSGLGVRLLALRCAGFNHVDLKAAREFGLPVVRVPAYSPNAVAEHSLCLLLALSRKLKKSLSRVQSLNFSLDGLVGFNLFQKTVGVIGTGKIGSEFVKIMKGLGTNVLAYDICQNEELRGACRYTTLDEVFEKSDVISLHLPLTPETRHLLNEETFSKMKKGVIVVNTSRGALIDTKALIQCLKNNHVGGAGLDVYEEEESVFFNDLSDQVLQDDVLARLITFPNTIVTSHQAFLTKEALLEIAETTIQNIKVFLECGLLQNQVTLELD